MLNFGASKPRVRGGLGPRGPPWIRTWLHSDRDRDREPLFPIVPVLFPVPVPVPVPCSVYEP